MSSPSRSRRRFVLGGLGLTGALVLGWGMLPERQRLQPGRDLPMRDGAVALNGWITIEADGHIGLVMPRTEMGQGIHTTLAMLVAEELDVAPDKVTLLPLVMDKIYANVAAMRDNVPLHPDDEGDIANGVRWVMGKVGRELGVILTGGSSSVKDAWTPLRHAAALARALLVDAAARRWQVDPASCRTEGGQVLHAQGQSASYGSLAKEALALAASIDPARVQPKAPAQFRLIGQPTARLDAAAKVRGAARYTGDVVLTGQLYAVPRMAPVFGARLRQFDDKAARAMHGVVGVFDVSSAMHEQYPVSAVLVAVADRHWTARRAAESIEVQWDEGKHAELNSAAILRDLGARLSDNRGSGYHSVGDIDKANPERVIDAEYHAPFLAHATMEPPSCKALVKDGQVWLWSGTQAPSFAVRAAARVAGVSEDKVHLELQYAGGGFGRRLDVDEIAMAVATAMQCPGRPVQLTWSREDDLAHDVYRPATLARLRAGLDKSGLPITWDCRAAGAAIAHHYNPRNLGLPGVGPDRAAAEGLYDMQYEIAHQVISHLAVDSAVPIGYWRGVGHSHNAFFKESFLDELAHAGGQDPVELRRRLLAKHPRHLAVLDAAVQRAGVPPEGRAHGVALHQSFGSIVAEVAEVSIEQGAIRVHRVVCAVDCGMVINPAGATQQVESAVVFGLTAALKGEVTIAKGRVEQTNFHDYPLLRMNEVPEVEVVFMPSTRAPEGLGEPPLAPVAPAVANAVFKLTGKRLRSLPLKL
ncbi:xanthine dehydrogenase family protein molybdopterin-binding subunit [Massilia sp. TS11]|uniref:xanthine dehydrogenase family protein molybdopterin-binding subunit n=1 Tax=Massilia sp. TS11 TaxID=2908003 RepID=UPI001EDB601E|nr:molybdopterin cofactor-binding domain-containing protein [Massilia sp. TS11]MCG2584257.1 molybdopterin-dependent oxidoreductase [Massilia sp. TS11]